MRQAGTTQLTNKPELYETAFGVSPLAISLSFGFLYA